MIKKFYSGKNRVGWKYDSVKEKYWSWGYNIRLDQKINGKRPRRQETGFFSKSDAEAAVARIRMLEKDRRHGFILRVDRPRFSELIAKWIAEHNSPAEQRRARRTFSTLLPLLLPDLYVDELTTDLLKRYLIHRTKTSVLPSTINREMNTIASCIHAAPILYPQLEQWKPPRIPRPAFSKRRRERPIRPHERAAVLEELLALRRDDESIKFANERYHVGLQLQFLLLTGVRHGEMDHITKTDVDFSRQMVKVISSKTERRVANPVRYVPLPHTALQIVRYFYDRSMTKYVFTRSGQMIPRFYRHLREACERAGVPYGQKTPGGIVAHDARHTVATELLEERVSPAQVQEQMGWTDRTFLLYYSHSTPESRAQAASVLERIAGNGMRAQATREEWPEIIGE